MNELNEPPRLEEAAMLSFVDELRGAGRVLCTSLGRGQFAAALASRSSKTHVHLSLLDVFQTEAAQRAAAGVGTNLTIACEADFPAHSYDAAALCVSRSGEAELVRDRLQSAYMAIKRDGRLVAATDNVNDKWLLEEMEALCGRVERRVVEVTQPTSDDDEPPPDDGRPRKGQPPRKPRAKSGAIYIGRRGPDPKKLRDFHAEFAFRDREQLIRAVTRPGVFSHRRLDLGARKILDAMEVAEGERVVDLGCGAGTIACAAAMRATNVVVRAVDSNARAIQATLAAAQLNGLTNVTADLSANGVLSDAGSFSLVLANPPYYSGFKISRVFLDAAKQALAPGGLLMLVTQFPDWYMQHAGAWFADVGVMEAKKYSIVMGRKR